MDYDMRYTVHIIMRGSCAAGPGASIPAAADDEGKGLTMKERWRRRILQPMPHIPLTSTSGDEAAPAHPRPTNLTRPRSL